MERELMKRRLKDRDTEEPEKEKERELVFQMHLMSREKRTPPGNTHTSTFATLPWRWFC